MSLLTAPTKILNSLMLLMVLVTTSCVVGEIQAPVDASGATVAPTLTSVNPTGGAIVGGQTLTLTGLAFSTGMTVDIGGVACSPVSVTSSTSATCTTGANSLGTKNITISDREGNRDTLVNGYTYRSAPTVSSISPVAGDVAGGTTVTVTGTDFYSGASVTIGGVTCSSVNVLSSTTLTCITGARTAALVQATVTNDDGQADTGGSFTYANPPVVTSVAPSAGAIAGGASVTVNGSNFTGTVTSVTIGGVACTSPVVGGSTSITCTLGDNTAQGAGNYDVVVTNSTGVVGTLGSGFTYQVAPAVTGVSPNGGPIAGGNTITISGTGFDTANGYTATVGGTACSAYAALTATSFNCTVPGGIAGAATIVVTNADAGNQSGSLAGNYTYQNGPSISTVVAQNTLAVSGPTTGGSPIRITGTNFISPTVTVGGTTCTVTSSNSTTIDCNTGTGTAGAANVVVTNSDTQFDTSVGAFTYEAVPTVTSISPAGGNQVGGTTITVNGTNLNGGSGTKVYFGSKAPANECSAYSAIGATSFTCNTPAGTIDTTVDVLVEIQDASKTTVTVTNGYTYQDAPTISSVSPNAGAESGGSTVTIDGTNFRTGIAVTIGGNPCASITVVSSTRLTCTTPAGTAGSRDIVVTNTDTQTATLTNGYTYQVPPTLTSISKTAGSTVGLYPITLTGTDFISPATVKIGGTSCSSPTTTGSTTISCTVAPGSLGTYDVVVTNPDGQTSTLSSGFTYQPPPDITSLSTPGGPPSGAGDPLVLTGTGFDNANTLSVEIGGVACDSLSSISSTSVTCDPPAMTVGTYNVVIKLNDGGNQQDVVSSGYTYAVAPTVSSISPAGGSTLGGTSVTITGSDFQNGASVSIGSTTCTGVSFVNATTLTCTTGARATGSVNVVVTNPDNQTGSITGGYLYADPPTVTGTSPNNGRLAGGSTVTINGTNFVPGAIGYINSIACTSSVVTSSTTIDCTVPVGTTAGSFDVKIINPDGQEAQASNAFSYVNPPTITGISPGIGPASGLKNGSAVTVTITGTDFDTVRGVASITLNGTNCSPITSITSTELQCTLKPGTAGNGDVVVTNNDADTQSDTMSGGFSYINAPSITTMTPTNGPAAGGTTLTFTGTGFIPGGPTTINIGSLGTCGTVNVIDSNNMTCITGPGTANGAVDVTVTNFDGQEASFSSFTYDPAPTITSISPTSGRLTGGSTLTITGTNFVTTPTVTVGGSACAPVGMGSTTSISCTLPAGVAGAADVVVTNPDLQTATLSGSYTYVAAPTVTGVSPSVVSTGTTTALTITGTGFINGTGLDVRIDPLGTNTQCTSAAFVSATQVTCTAPAGLLTGNYTIRVINGDGDNQPGDGVSLLNYVNPPTITSIVPANGPLTGGTVTINGTGLDSPPTPTVDVGGQACTSVTPISSTQLTCVIPATSTAGNANVRVTTYTNITSGPSIYTYDPPPTVTNVSPTFGDDNGGTAITITGSDFVATPTSITIGGVPCTGIGFTNVNTITCTTGANATTDTALDIIVTNPDGQTDTGSALFTYLDPPSITSVSPSGGKASGGETITITGTNFTNPAAVTINGSTCSAPTVTGETTITCTSPVLAGTATYNVTVTNMDGQADVEASAWQAQAEPTITSITPNNGDESGGTSVIITGTNFESGGSVFFGSTGVSFDTFSATSVTVTAPAGNPGAVNLMLQNPTGQSVTQASGYTYNPASAEVQFVVGTLSPNPPNPANYFSDSGSAGTPAVVNESQTFTLKNVGSAVSNSLSISISGANAGAFFLNADTCSGNTLAANAECTVDVIFLGSIVGAGSYDATLNATDGTTSSSNNLEAR